MRGDSLSGIFSPCVVTSQLTLCCRWTNLTDRPKPAMYSEWASVQQEIQTDTANISVLHNFPDVVGKEVANSVVKNLAQNLSLSAANNEEPSHLSTPAAVKWTMQVFYITDISADERDVLCLGY